MLHTAVFLLAATASCNHDPSVVKLGETTVPKTYYAQFSGTYVATVAITLDASGNVTDAHIYQSTGDARLDDAAIDAAKRSTFSPGETNCAPSGGTFGVQFQFVGQKPGAADQHAACPRDASVVRAVNVQPSYWPPVHGDLRVGVVLTIDPTGKVIDAQIAQSSNTKALDQAAIDSARASTYLPKLIAVPLRRQAGAGQTGPSAFVCKAVTGDYLFRVTYRVP